MLILFQQNVQAEDGIAPGPDRRRARRGPLTDRAMWWFPTSHAAGAEDASSSSRDRAETASTAAATAAAAAAATAARDVPDRAPDADAKKKERGDGAKAEDEEEEEEEEEETCGFCKFMKGGSCKATFVKWEACVDAAKERDDDYVAECAKQTEALRDCMLADPGYYGEMLPDEKEDDDEKGGGGGKKKEEDAEEVAEEPAAKTRAEKALGK
jgi:hypothetical protein